MMNINFFVPSFIEINQESEIIASREISVDGQRTDGQQAICFLPPIIGGGKKCGRASKVMQIFKGWALST